MIRTQKLKAQLVVATALVDNGSFTVTDVDAGGQGARYLDFLIILGTVDIACTVFKVQHSDDDSDYADITGAAFTGSELPQADDSNTIWHIGINVANGLKRFYRIVLTSGNGTNGVQATVIVLLSDLEVSPTTAALRGFAGEKLV